MTAWFWGWQRTRLALNLIAQKRRWETERGRGNKGNVFLCGSQTKAQGPHQSCKGWVWSLRQMSGGLNEQKGTNSVDSGVAEKAAGVCNARAWGTATFAPTASIVNITTTLLHRLAILLLHRLLILLLGRLLIILLHRLAIILLRKRDSLQTERETQLCWSSRCLLLQFECHPGFILYLIARQYSFLQSYKLAGWAKYPFRRTFWVYVVFLPDIFPDNANCHSMVRRALTSQMIGLEEGVRRECASSSSCSSSSSSALTRQMIGLEEGVRRDLCIFIMFFFIFFSLDKADDRPKGGSEEGLMHLENGSRLLGCDAACQNIAGDDLLLFCKVYSYLKCIFCIFLLFCHCGWWLPSFCQVYKKFEAFLALLLSSLIRRLDYIKPTVTLHVKTLREMTCY